MPGPKIATFDARDVNDTKLELVATGDSLLVTLGGCSIELEPGQLERFIEFAQALCWTAEPESDGIMFVDRTA